MNTVRFVKSFSKGQITIPKDIRERFGITSEFWLKLYVHDGKIIAEPIEKQNNTKEYLKKILSIKGDWFDPKEIKKNRREIERRLKKLWDEKTTS